ncbi:MAG: hypothetical protein ACFFAZ_16150 [Promethearchaeota archaeon]
MSRMNSESHKSGAEAAAIPIYKETYESWEKKENCTYVTSVSR